MKVVKPLNCFFLCASVWVCMHVHEHILQWLADGCVLGKYTHDGRGPIHKRFFWVDIAHTEVSTAHVAILMYLGS